MTRWQVKRLESGDFGVRPTSQQTGWHDSFETHSEAMIWAERQAVIDMIFDGCLASVGELKRWLNAAYPAHVIRPKRTNP